MSTLSLSGLRKSFGGPAVLEGIDLEVADGEFVSLLGPSGCGKTTTLNIVAGFQTPDAGEVRIGGRRVNDVPVHERNLGMVFQGHALFPHMTCFENVAFGLRMRGLAEAELRSRVGEALELVHLGDFGGRFPRELSGGQQQRVGLARALAIRPAILLLDEPLSNLDAKLRKAMQGELRQIHTQVRTTMIYVTHDQEEALTLSDRIAVMNEGRIEQLDTPEGIYARPKTRFVADFIGASSFVEGLLFAGGDGECTVEVPGAGHVRVRAPDGTVAMPGAKVQLGVRADRVRIVAPTADGATLHGTVVDRVFAGAVHHVIVDLGEGRRVTAHESAAPADWVRSGARAGLRVDAADWMLLA
ncbi:ABC transporter ATP-binding protein [Ramlibacter sp.]|uniref:ABC transporter ATP-binding protein n=1 Tax=Ramlibacter sp. TaxID=1917967 RepID=UPI003D0EF926